VLLILEKHDLLHFDHILIVLDLFDLLKFKKLPKTKGFLKYDQKPYKKIPLPRGEHLTYSPRGVKTNMKKISKNYLGGQISSTSNANFGMKSD